MAKKKEKIPQSRILTKYISGVTLTRVVDTPFATVNDGASDWKVITIGSNAWGVWTGYIDLTGMTVEQGLTCAVEVADVQESQPVQSDSSSGCLMHDLVHVVPIDWETALGKTDGTVQTLPGMLGSNENIESIVKGKMRHYFINSNVPAPGAVLLGNTSTWGVNQALASDRIYISRVVFFGGEVNEAQRIPACVVALATTFFEEAELSHMERLRRSYLLQG